MARRIIQKQFRVVIFGFSKAVAGAAFKTVGQLALQFEFDARGLNVLNILEYELTAAHRLLVDQVIRSDMEGGG